MLDIHRSCLFLDSTEVALAVQAPSCPPPRAPTEGAWSHFSGATRGERWMQARGAHTCGQSVFCRPPLAPPFPHVCPLGARLSRTDLLPRRPLPEQPLSELGNSRDGCRRTCHVTQGGKLAARQLLQRLNGRGNGALGGVELVTGTARACGQRIALAGDVLARGRAATLRLRRHCAGCALALLGRTQRTLSLAVGLGEGNREGGGGRGAKRWPNEKTRGGSSAERSSACDSGSWRVLERVSHYHCAALRPCSLRTPLFPPTLPLLPVHCTDGLEARELARGVCGDAVRRVYELGHRVEQGRPVATQLYTYACTRRAVTHAAAHRWRTMFSEYRSARSRQKKATQGGMSHVWCAL